jgi:hypothetical protein
MLNNQNNLINEKNLVKKENSFEDLKKEGSNENNDEFKEKNKKNKFFGNMILKIKGKFNKTG